MPAPAAKPTSARAAVNANTSAVLALLEEPTDKDAEELGPHIMIIQAGGKPSRFALKGSYLPHVGRSAGNPAGDWEAARLDIDWRIDANAGAVVNLAAMHVSPRSTILAHCFGTSPGLVIGGVNGIIANFPRD